MPKKAGFREKFFFQFGASIRPWHGLAFSAKLGAFPLDITSPFRRHPARTLCLLLGAVLIILVVREWFGLSSQRPQQGRGPKAPAARALPPSDP